MSTLKRVLQFLFLLLQKHNLQVPRALVGATLTLSVLLIACDSENANDCLQTDGNNITYELELAPFDRIQVENDVQLIVKQGEQQNVRVQTGENLVSDLNIEVDQQTLVLQNNNGCNFIRDYGVTIVTVTSPNIVFIRQASSFPVSSDGVLTYPSLTIWSNTNPNTLNIEDANKSGSVILNLDVPQFIVQANGSSNFQITGRADTATISFSDEFPQFHGASFLVNDLRIAQTSAANMVVHPINNIQGIIRGVGDVISVNEPLSIDVEALFTGELIFQD